MRQRNWLLDILIDIDLIVIRLVMLSVYVAVVVVRDELQLVSRRS